jgi:probable rRNA maturation factor
MPQKNSLSLSVQYADARLKDTVTRPLLRRWVNAALFAPAELTLRFVDAEEGRKLNRKYRQKDYATNVLTFSYDEPDQPADTPVRADIVLCTDVLQEEANAQKKTVLEHTAHLVVHGVLHAQGYDHETEEEAEEMELLERDIMTALELPDPHLER